MTGNRISEEQVNVTTLIGHFLFTFLRLGLVDRVEMHGGYP
jgi:hypothetical protein